MTSEAESYALNCGITFDNNQINILMYADGIGLLSLPADDLQNMLNTLNSWCNMWHLAVNESKTKVVHFRNKNQLQSNYSNCFKCDENAIAYESEYNYLGFWFNKHLDMEKICNSGNESS